MGRFRFDKLSFGIFVALFVVEVLIALYVNDTIIRPYGGDFLVVIMIYYFVKSFVNIRKSYLCIAVLLFAYFVEFTQYLNLVEFLGVQDNRWLVVVLGNSFSWGDMLAYTMGIGFCYLIDRK